MVVEKLSEFNPPSGKVPGQVRRVVPILESRRRWNRGRYREKGFVPRISGTRSKYRPKGGTRGGPPTQAATWRGQGVAVPPRREPPGPPSGL